MPPALNWEEKVGTTIKGQKILAFFRNSKNIPFYKIQCGCGKIEAVRATTFSGAHSRESCAKCQRRKYGKFSIK